MGRSAAFRRLCVETDFASEQKYLRLTAAFRRLCVETLLPDNTTRATYQPPLGGCVLKHSAYVRQFLLRRSAAFRRLCVETSVRAYVWDNIGAAAFRRLCVETSCDKSVRTRSSQPPLGGCVLKRPYAVQSLQVLRSRL